MTDNIYTAICAAMGDMKRLPKDSRNAEQKYDFASVDDFLAMTGPVMAKHGIFIQIDEDDFMDFQREGKYGPTHWLRIRFIITVQYKDGSALAPVRRTVEVIRTGAQSSGSAQSYVLKQFQRALFCIPTGDRDDPDYGAEAEASKPASAPPPARKPEPQVTPDAIANACDYMTRAETLDDLAANWRNLPAHIKAVPAVVAAKDARKAQLTKPADDLGGDKIPY